MADTSLSLRERENGRGNTSLQGLASPLTRKLGSKSKTPNKPKTKYNFISSALFSSLRRGEEERRKVAPQDLMELSTGVREDQGRQVEAVMRRNKDLEEEREMLRARVATLEEERDQWAREREQVAAQQRGALERHEARVAELEAALAQVQRSKEEEGAEEGRRVRDLRRERAEARQEAATLSTKLARAEDYLRVSKELSATLQAETQRLQVELSRVQGEAQAQAAQLQVRQGQGQALDEVQAALAQAQKQVRDSTLEKTLTERQLFQTLLLALKLDAELRGEVGSEAPLDPDWLWSEAQRRGLGVDDWGSYLAHVFAERANQEPRARLRRPREEEGEEQKRKRPRRAEVYSHAKQ